MKKNLERKLYPLETADLVSKWKAYSSTLYTLNFRILLALQSLSCVTGSIT